MVGPVNVEAKESTRSKSIMIHVNRTRMLTPAETESVRPFSEKMDNDAEMFQKEEEEIDEQDEANDAAERAENDTSLVLETAGPGEEEGDMFEAQTARKKGRTTDARMSGEIMESQETNQTSGQQVKVIKPKNKRSRKKEDERGQAKHRYNLRSSKGTNIVAMIGDCHSSDEEDGEWSYAFRPVYINMHRQGQGKGETRNREEPEEARKFKDPEPSLNTPPCEEETIQASDNKEEEQSQAIPEQEYTTEVQTMLGRREKQQGTDKHAPLLAAIDKTTQTSLSESSQEEEGTDSEMTSDFETLGKPDDEDEEVEEADRRRADKTRKGKPEEQGPATRSRGTVADLPLPTTCPTRKGKGSKEKKSTEV